jgi:fluoroquinolone transport system permease protein
MNRLINLTRWEVAIQRRQGIYYAAIFVILVWSAILFAVPDGAIQPLLISVLYLDLSIFGFFFMAALFYLEKGDRVLDGLVVTPMRSQDYLLVKAGTLTVVSILTGAAVSLIVYGPGLNWGWYALSVALMAGPASFLGFALATRYGGISDFLVSSILYVFLLQIPLVSYFGMVDFFGLYLIPSGPSMILLAAAFHPMPAWQIGFALIYGALVNLIAFWLARRAFERTVTGQAGG